MKKIALFALLLAFSAARIATAEDDVRIKQRVAHPAVAKKFEARVVNHPRAVGPAGVNARASVNVARPSFARTRSFQSTPRFNSDISARARVNRSFNPRIARVQPRVYAPTPRVTSVTVAPVDTTVGVRSGHRNGRGNGSWNGNTNTRTWTGGEQARRHNGNWQANGTVAGGSNFTGAHRDWNRHHQNRNWWRSRYSRFALFGGGYYYWNSGYWYPAYGYDPYYSTYVYDAPLYGYNDLEPQQVVARVQSALQRRGYDPGGVDGDFGPMTRRALLDYQQDNGLPVTGEIDATTLSSLGLE